jgi:outer membrane protein
MINNRLTVLAAALAAAFASVPAQAIEAGDLLVRLGPTRVNPNDSSDCFNGPGAPGACTEGEVKNDNELGITLEYMMSDSLGVQLLASTPFNHKINASIDGNSVGVVGKTKHLPPTLTLNYHFNTEGTFVPFIGAGVNYTWFFDENTTGALNGLDLNLSDSWGAAGIAGVDWQLEDDYLFSMEVWYAKIATEAHISGGIGSADVDIDPWIFKVSLGKKF